MNEEIGKGGTTGDQWTGKKIDIAKKMLKAAISQLHPSTMFNVITFNTDARQFNELGRSGSPRSGAGSATDKRLRDVSTVGSSELLSIR